MSTEYSELRNKSFMEKYAYIFNVRLEKKIHPDKLKAEIVLSGIFLLQY